MRDHYDIVYLNILEERHGSTHRARQLAAQLARFWHTLYVESNLNGSGLAQPDMDVVSVSRGGSPAGLMRSAGEFFQTCCSVDYDILFLQKPWLVTLPCVLAARARGARVVIDYDDVDSLWQTTPFKRHFAFAGELAMPRLADLVTTHNEWLKGDLTHRGFRVSLVEQGVDTRAFDPIRYDKDREKERLNLTGYQVFCFLGSFTAGSARDLKPILEAYREVERARRDVHLLIVGGGGPLEDHFRDEIKRLGIERLTITGRMPQRDVPRHLAAADFGLIYMRDDDANRARVSFKVLEYLAMGLPVVGQVVGATAEMFGRYLLVSGAGAALSRAMLRAAGSSAGDRPRPSEARDYIVGRYDWNRVGEGLRATLEGLSAR